MGDTPKPPAGVSCTCILLRRTMVEMLYARVWAWVAQQGGFEVAHVEMNLFTLLCVYSSREVRMIRKCVIALLALATLVALVMGILIAATCAPDNSGIGGDWNPEALRLSPDGSKLLRYHDLSLYVMNPDGTDEKELVSGDGDSWAMGALWSPDSSRIACRMWWPSGMRSEIWVINADGSGKVRVGGVPYPYTVSSIIWSADGAQITYTCLDNIFALLSSGPYQPGPDKTYTVKADGSSY